MKTSAKHFILVAMTIVMALATSGCLSVSSSAGQNESPGDTYRIVWAMKSLGSMTRESTKRFGMHLRNIKTDQVALVWHFKGKGSDVQFQTDWENEEKVQFTLYDFGLNVAPPFREYKTAPRRILKVAKFRLNKQTDKFEEVASPK